MKILLTILGIIVGLIVLALLIALFVKKDYTVQREIVINKPKQQVFDYIRYLKNQDNYSKWAMMDPNMKKSYSGIDGQPGFVSSWESDNKDVGTGSQEIKGIKDGEKIDLGLHFIKPFEGRADAWMTTTALSPEQTKVTWGFHSKMKYPMNIMLLVMNMEKMIGDDLSTGLNNLKKLMESK
jgi:hypothetical protein